MNTPPNPREVFLRAAAEGERRLNQSLLELLATGFIAGLTIIFGMVAQGILTAAAEPSLGDLGHVVGALGFGLGVAFLILGRAELFSENFFDPVASLFQKSRSGRVARLARLWALTFVLNLVGGGLLIAVMVFADGLPSGASDSLSRMAEEIAGRPLLAIFSRSIFGGALVALLSYLVLATGDTAARVFAAYAVGVLLALGPFDHVVVSLLHLGFGFALDAQVSWARAAWIALIATAGNLIGGVGLVTFSHAAQAKGGEPRGGD